MKSILVTPRPARERRTLTSHHGTSARRQATVKCTVAIAGAAIAFLAGCQDPGPMEPYFSVDPAGAAATARLRAPSNVVAHAASSTQIDLSWQDNSGNETGFEIHRSTTGASGAFTPWSGTDANVQDYTDELLLPSTEYCYKVRASRLVGVKIMRSAFSNTGCATTPTTPPLAPVSARAVESSGSTLMVTWDQVSGEDGFRIERSTDGLAEWTLAATVGIDVTSWLADQVACYRIIASNTGGDSPPSPVACPVPAAPTGLTVTLLSPDSLELAWSDNSAIEDAYEVWVGYDWSCASWNGDYFLLADLPANSTSLRTSIAATGGPSGCPPFGFAVLARRTGVYSGSAGTYY